MPKGRGRGAAQPLREVGKHPKDGKPIYLYEGKYGFYVKHEEKNATVGRDSLDPASVTVELAVAALEQAPEPKRKRTSAKGTGAKKAPAAARPRKAASPDAEAKPTSSKAAKPKRVAKPKAAARKKAASTEAGAAAPASAAKGKGKSKSPAGSSKAARSGRNAG